MAKIETPKVNRHGDHEATCLCCQNCVLDYEPDYSEWTPGEGATIRCSKGHFRESGSDFGNIDEHALVTLARRCPDFLARCDS